MSEVRIAAEPRTEFGKGAARRARRAGKVPAVLYGHGIAPRHINLPGHDLMLALKTPNVLLRLEGVDEKESLVLPKSVQRDPIKVSSSTWTCWSCSGARRSWSRFRCW